MKWVLVLALGSALGGCASTDTTPDYKGKTADYVREQDETDRQIADAKAVQNREIDQQIGQTAH